MGLPEPQSNLLVISTVGYGKCSSLEKYRIQSRGGYGIRTFKVTSKTGRVAMARVVDQGLNQEIMLVSAKGQVIRITLREMRSVGRITQGVIFWRDREPDDFLASVTCLPDSETDDEPENGERRARSKNGSSSQEVNGSNGLDAPGK